MRRLEWGNKHARFQLESPSEEVWATAEAVLSRWHHGPQSRHHGTWTIQPENGHFRVISPESTRRMLEQENLPDCYDLPELAVKAVEFQAVYTSLNSPGGPPGFHGALLSKGDSAIGIVGNKEAGKSTLSTYLWRRGYQLHSDDGFQIDVDSMTCVPTPRRSRVRAGCRALLGEATWEELASMPQTLADSDGSLLYSPGPHTQDPVTLKAIVILRSAAGEMETLHEAEATTELVVLNHLYYGEGLARSIATTSNLCNRLKAYRLGRGSLETRARWIGTLL